MTLADVMPIFRFMLTLLASWVIIAPGASLLGSFLLNGRGGREITRDDIDGMNVGIVRNTLLMAVGLSILLSLYGGG